MYPFFVLPLVTQSFSNDCPIINFKGFRGLFRDTVPLCVSGLITFLSCTLLSLMNPLMILGYSFSLYYFPNTALCSVILVFGSVRFILGALCSNMLFTMLVEVSRYLCNNDTLNYPITLWDCKVYHKYLPTLVLVSDAL